ncbi:hypothetical protein [Iodobacter sp.]|uniref:hypothetical protein n=1 Tax=Iodobacter sp. TaxID=1915058 RepID=UPI0025FCCC7A|nr:hypothetical protein [Iodobacter sp.]
MQLIFPNWKTQNKSQIQALELAEKEGAIPDYLIAASENNESSAYLFNIVAEQLVRLDANRVVLMTSASPVDKQGNSVSFHQSAGLISAFWFKQVDGRWYADGKQTQVDWVGAMGQVGKTKVVKLSSNKFALGIESANCYQGACFTDLSLYELGSSKVLSILPQSIRIAADTQGTHEDCDQVFKQAPKKLIQTRYPVESYSGFDCVDVKSDWHIKINGPKPGDLLISFSGFVEERTNTEEIAAEDGAKDSTFIVDSILSTIKQQQQLFRYREGKYHLMSGKNPTPEF